MMVIILVANFLIAIVLSGGSADAQEIMGDVTVTEITAGGAIKGCAVEYTSISQDHIYKSGAPVGLTGTLAWMLAPKLGIALATKVLAADIDVTQPSQLAPFKVEHGFARINDRLLQVENRYECEKPTGFCGASGFETAMSTFEEYAKGGETVAFGFNRKIGGMDVVMSVKPLSLDQSTKLSACMLKVLEAAKDLGPK
ncbi:MAG: hypothetical protein C0519_01385 [Hyphomicrobium sp.]|nr:hypothetical protein [Hyphomicrobium sp.]PPD09551.1 MAG: hypothetical protein CTY28_01720 [Hyphomicrobium sp.]